MVRPIVISFHSFADELTKLAQGPSTERTVGTGIGAGAGALVMRKALKDLPPKSKLRLLGILGGAAVGGLGGRELGEGTRAAREGLTAMGQTGRLAAENVRQAMS